MGEFVQSLLQYDFNTFFQQILTGVGISTALYMLISFTVWAVFHTVRFFKNITN